MSKEKLFNFTPAHHLIRKEIKTQVSYNATTHFLSFIRKDNPAISGLVGKWIQFYADTEKKALAWSFAPKEYTSPPELRGYTQIKDNASTVRAYIPKPIVDALKMLAHFKKFEVKTYKPTGYSDNNHYHYIEL